MKAEDKEKDTHIKKDSGPTKAAFIKFLFVLFSLALSYIVMRVVFHSQSIWLTLLLASLLVTAAELTYAFFTKRKNGQNSQNKKKG